MNQEAKIEKKPKTKSKVQIRDLKPKKDVWAPRAFHFLDAGLVQLGHSKVTG
jgi:hypothetical protein